MHFAEWPEQQQSPPGHCEYQHAQGRAFGFQNAGWHHQGIVEQVVTLPAGAATLKSGKQVTCGQADQRRPLQHQSHEYRLGRL